MILVDSSVWIDYFNGKENKHTDFLDSALGNEIICIGDLILTEVLQGFINEKEYKAALEIFDTLYFFELGGKEVAIQASQNYRFLRLSGVTIRKTIDVIIATFCIKNGFRILHNDGDFDPFVTHLGLKSIF